MIPERVLSILLLLTISFKSLATYQLDLSHEELFSIPSNTSEKINIMLHNFEPYSAYVCETPEQKATISTFEATVHSCFEVHQEQPHRVIIHTKNLANQAAELLLKIKLAASRTSDSFIDLKCTKTYRRKRKYNQITTNNLSLAPFSISSCGSSQHDIEECFKLLKEIVSLLQHSDIKRAKLFLNNAKGKFKSILESPPQYIYSLLVQINQLFVSQNSKLEWALKKPRKDVLSIRNKKRKQAIVIDTPAELQMLNAPELSHEIFILGQNIDLYQYPSFIPIGQGDEGEPFPFCGEFYGNGFCIKNLTITQLYRKHIGLFSTANRAVFSNVKLCNGLVKGLGYIGSLVGKVDCCHIRSCSSSDIEIRSKSPRSDLDKDSLAIGGLIGEAIQCCIKDCHTSKLSLEVKNYYIGGLIGRAENTVIDVSSSQHFIIQSGSQIGGLVGILDKKSLLQHSYAEGKINEQDGAGGLVGILQTGTIKDAYSFCSLREGCENGGGLVGYINKKYKTAVINCYAIDNQNNVVNALPNIESVDIKIATNSYFFNSFNHPKITDKAYYYQWNFVKSTQIEAPWVMGPDRPYLRFELVQSIKRLLSQCRALFVLDSFLPRELRREILELTNEIPKLLNSKQITLIENYANDRDNLLLDDKNFFRSRKNLIRDVLKATDF